MKDYNQRVEVQLDQGVVTIGWTADEFKIFELGGIVNMLFNGKIAASWLIKELFIDSDMGFWGILGAKTGL